MYSYNTSFALSQENFTTAFNDSILVDFKNLIEASFSDFQKTIEGKELNQDSRYKIISRFYIFCL